MVQFARIATWPLAWKAPLLVASLMVGIAVMISQVVRSRLASDQETNLRVLTDAYLDGLSAAVLDRTLPLAAVRDAAERRQIERVLRETNGQIIEAAKRLDISRTTLWEKMRRYGLVAGETNE